MLLGVSECDNVIGLSMRSLQSPNFKESILLNIRKEKFLLGLIPAVHSIQPSLSEAVISVRRSESMKETDPIETFEKTCLQIKIKCGIITYYITYKSNHISKSRSFRFLVFMLLNKHFRSSPSAHLWNFASTPHFSAHRRDRGPVTGRPLEFQPDGVKLKGIKTPVQGHDL